MKVEDKKKTVLHLSTQPQIGEIAWEERESKQTKKNGRRIE
jgi:hypothetical protein